MAPLQVDSEVIDAHLKLIRLKKMVLRSDADATIRLLSNLKEQLSFLKEDVRKHLLDTNIYILPLPICMAWTGDDDQETPSIVVSTGFMNLIANSILHASLVDILPSQFDEVYMLYQRRDMPARNLFANAVFLMNLRNYRYGEPLPNISGILEKSVLNENKDSICGALLFVLLHELGHIRLGYLESELEFSGPTNVDQVIDETISLDKSLEVEADVFALNSLIDEAKILGTYWHRMAMNFFIQMEIVSGSPLDTEHPLAINRSYHSDKMREVCGKEMNVQSTPGLYDDLSGRFNATSQVKMSAIPELLNTTREGCISVLKDIARLPGLPIQNMKKLWSQPPDNWFNL